MYLSFVQQFGALNKVIPSFFQRCDHFENMGPFVKKRSSDFFYFLPFLHMKYTFYPYKTFGSLNRNDFFRLKRGVKNFCTISGSRDIANFA